jgi:hypothetical protein
MMHENLANASLTPLRENINCSWSLETGILNFLDQTHRNSKERHGNQLCSMESSSKGRLGSQGISHVFRSSRRDLDQGEKFAS